MNNNGVLFGLLCLSAFDVGVRQRLLDEQTGDLGLCATFGLAAYLHFAALFRKTTQKNTDLGTRVLELERELAVWKLAFKSNDEENSTLKKQVARLERNIGSLKVRVDTTLSSVPPPTLEKRMTTRWYFV
jgi:hypothetical protein